MNSICVTSFYMWFLTTEEQMHSNDIKGYGDSIVIANIHLKGLMADRR